VPHIVPPDRSVYLALTAVEILGPEKLLETGNQLYGQLILLKSLTSSHPTMARGSEAQVERIVSDRDSLVDKLRNLFKLNLRERRALIDALKKHQEQALAEGRALKGPTRLKQP
jgi:hypothetical protein